MNPLLFADWRRMNRLFTRVMWGVAAVMLCVICIALTSGGPAAHAAPGAHAAGAAGAAGGARAAATAGGPPFGPAR